MPLSIYQLLTPWYWLPYQIDDGWEGNSEESLRGKTLNRLKLHKGQSWNLCGQGNREQWEGWQVRGHSRYNLSDWQFLLVTILPTAPLNYILEGVSYERILGNLSGPFPWQVPCWKHGCRTASVLGLQGEGRFLNWRWSPGRTSKNSLEVISSF